MFHVGLVCWFREGIAVGFVYVMKVVLVTILSIHFQALSISRVLGANTPRAVLLTPNYTEGKMAPKTLNPNTTRKKEQLTARKLAMLRTSLKR